MAKIILSDIFEGNYPVSQTFGANPAYYGQFYIYGVKQKGHEGVDFATPIGVNIKAPFDGRVLRVGYQTDFSNYGKVVVLWDSVQKCAVWFCHLSETNVAIGAQIKKGQIMGKTGSTGNVTGSHLHFCIVYTDANGNRLNAGDGYGGFFDCLDPNKVQWVLGGGSTQPSIDPYTKKLDDLKIAIDRLQHELASDMTNPNANKQQLFNDTIAKVKKIADTGTL